MSQINTPQVNNNVPQVNNNADQTDNNNAVTPVKVDRVLTADDMVIVMVFTNDDYEWSKKDAVVNCDRSKLKLTLHKIPKYISEYFKTIHDVVGESNKSIYGSEDIKSNDVIILPSANTQAFTIMINFVKENLNKMCEVTEFEKMETLEEMYNNIFAGIMDENIEKISTFMMTAEYLQSDFFKHLTAKKIADYVKEFETDKLKEFFGLTDEEVKKYENDDVDDDEDEEEKDDNNNSQTDNNNNNNNAMQVDSN
jgi:hypothetical protein